MAGITPGSGSSNIQSQDTRQLQYEDLYPQDDDVQIINSTLSARRYPNITVKKGTPVKWVINAPKNSITGCNARMYIGEYGIEHTFEEGDNVIEFTPVKAGKFQYTCWMGMIRATITVTE